MSIECAVSTPDVDLGDIEFEGEGLVSRLSTPSMAAAGEEMNSQHYSQPPPLLHDHHPVGICRRTGLPIPTLSSALHRQRNHQNDVGPGLISQTIENSDFRHPLAPHGAEAKKKYHDYHYNEDTVPSQYTAVDDNGTLCRYIVLFLVYSTRGERLQSIEGLNEGKRAEMSLYGQLLPAAAVQDPKRMETIYGMLKSKKARNYAAMGNAATYPVYAILDSWNVEYGSQLTDTPAIWLKSAGGAYYKLHEPAGRYERTFRPVRRSLDVAARFLKTLQADSNTPLEVLLNLICYGVRDSRLAETIDAAQKDAKKERLNLYNTDSPTDPEAEKSQSTEDGIVQSKAETDNYTSGHAIDHRPCRQKLNGLLFASGQTTPWGEYYRVGGYLTPPEVIAQFGRFILQQATIFAETYNIPSIPQSPAMQRLQQELNGGMHHLPLAFGQQQQSPAAAYTTTGATPNAYMLSPGQGSSSSSYQTAGPSTYPVGANPSPISQPVYPNTVSQRAYVAASTTTTTTTQPPATSAQAYTPTNYSATASPNYSTNSGSMMYPRMWMRTALHVFDAKAIPNYWMFTPKEQAAKPYFLGYDWLWSPHVVVGVGVSDESPPLPVSEHVILPERDPASLPPPPPINP